MSKQNIIDQNSAGLVITEIPVQISDEKFKRLLSQAYEYARRDARKWHWYDLSGNSLTAAATLFITLLTSTFNGIQRWGLTGDDITCYGWILLTVLFIFGCVASIARAQCKNNGEASERDIAVQHIWENHCS